MLAIAVFNDVLSYDQKLGKLISYKSLLGP